MRRGLLLAPVFLLVGCAPTLVRSQGVWRYEKEPHALTATPDGRLMPEGWALTNFRRLEPGRLGRLEPTSYQMLFVRRQDDGILSVEPVKLSQPKSLRTLVDRYLDEVRVMEETTTITNWAGIAVAQGTRRVEHPVRVLFSAGFGSSLDGKLEGHETVIAQRRPGEEAPYRLIYVAFVRPAKSLDVVEISYVNTSSSFADGLEDARAFVRRLRFGALQFEETPPAPLNTEGGGLRI